MGPPTLQRQDSIASSTVASGFHDLALQSGILQPGSEKDDLLQTPSLESGVFGVLFTLSQEKNQHHIRYQWIVLKNILTAWQIFTTIVSPEMGWAIDAESAWWKGVSVLTFRWLKDLGYGAYIGFLYSLAGLLAVNLGLCVWVAWSFKEQKFDYVWPIKVVRGFSYVFLQVFDITSLSFLQLGISCNYMGPQKPRLHLNLFPQHSCSSVPHVVNAVVSGMLLLIFVAMTLLVNMSEVEVNPASKSPQALGHSGAEVTAFGIKALMTLVGVFIGHRKAAAVLYLVLAVWLAWEYLRWVPHLLTWVNCVKTGIAVAMCAVAGLQVAVVFQPGSSAGRQMAYNLTVIMLGSLGPAFVLGAVAAWMRTQMFTAAVIHSFRTTDPEAVKPGDVHHFSHPRDVEVAARSARVWTDLYTLDKAAVHMAEDIIKAGIALFPDDAFVSLTYANFMLDMLGFSQTGAKQLESVRKLGPGIMCRFMLFVRQQQATQKAASSTVGKGGNMDLLGYVEYQRKQRTVMRHHKDALQAMANFWRILGSSSISFNSLSKSLEEIDTSVSKAESAYRVAMELYNNSPRLVRLYARFLETIKQDPWAATQFYASADRLEESKDFQGQGPSLPDGTPMSRMDDVEKGILVVNAFGDIQVANRKLHDMFGYRKGELDGKNVMVLMPPHEAKRHPALLRRYIDSGEKAPPFFRHPVLGIHRERVALTVRIAVSRASGMGEDSVFIGILELLPTESGLGRVWVTKDGVIVCCDPGFVTCFGYRPDDVIGTQLYKLLRSSLTTGDQGTDRNVDVWVTNQANHDKQELVHRMLAAAVRSEGSSLGEEATVCRVLHKYDFAKECSVTVKRDETDTSILEVRMKLLSDEPQLLMVVERKGAIRHMSGDLAMVLGVWGGADVAPNGRQLARSGTSGGGGGPAQMSGDDQVMMELMAEAPPCSLDDFLPTPWKAMHYKYRKYVNGGSPNLSGAWGCRAVLDDAAGGAGPTMQLVGLHGKPVFVHVNVTSREEEGEPMHVVRMARSSMETAISERRIRMRLGPDGKVAELVTAAAVGPLAANSASKSIAELFDFPPEELLDCRLWEFLSLATGRKPATPPGIQNALLDLYSEAEAAMMRGSDKDAPIAGVGCPSGGSVLIGGGGGGVGAATMGDIVYEALDIGMLDEMITSSLQTPGISWRVHIVSPVTAVEAAALGHPARAAAVLSKRTKEAILRLHVTLPPPAGKNPGAGSPSSKLQVHAELWPAEAVTGVLQLDAAGRISGILEDEVRPPGLLFGLPTEELVGAKLDALLRLGPGQSAAGLLNDSGVTKKSALKSSNNRKGRTATKVGPVHYLDGFHRDGLPLHLAIQVVGKPGPGNPVVVVVRITDHKHATRKHLVAGAAAGAAMAVLAAAPARSHVSLAFQGKPGTAAIAAGDRPPNDAAAAAVGEQLGADGSFRLRLQDPATSGTTATTTNATAVASAGKGGTPSASESKAATPSGDILSEAIEVGIVEEAEALPETKAQPAVAIVGQPLKPAAPPPRVNLTSLVMPRVAGDATTLPSVPSAPALPGANSLAAGVAAALRARTMTSNRLLGGGAGNLQAGGNGDGPTGSGTFRKYDSLNSMNDDHQGSSSDSRTAHIAMEPPGVVNPGGLAALDMTVLVASAPEMVIEKTGLGYSEVRGKKQGLDAGAGALNEWVSSDPKFYGNKSLSFDESGLRGYGDDDEDENDDAASFGGISRATSFHWNQSPRASESGGTEYGNGTEYGTGTEYESHAHQRHPAGPRGAGGHPHGSRLPGGGFGGMGGPHQLAAHQHGNGQQGNHAAQSPGPKLAEMGSGNISSTSMGANNDGTAGSLMDLRLEDHGIDSDGESDSDGMSGGSDNSDDVTPADYKRGKRYRKLVRLMNSPHAKKAMIRLKFNTSLAVVAAAAVHVLSFALIITAIQRQSHALQELQAVGGGQRYLQRALVAVRALDQVYKGKGNATYGDAGTEEFANDLLTFSNLYRDVTRVLLQENGGTIESLFYTQGIEVWSGFNASTQESYYEELTLWDLLTRVFVSAKAVFQNHRTWHSNNESISSKLPAAFLLRSGQALSPGLRQILKTVLDLAVKRTDMVNNLQLTFLLLEGCLVTCCTAIGLLYMLKSAFDQRYQLYETFLAIPIGLTRALAAQTTHMLDDDESDDQDDDDDAGSGKMPNEDGMDGNNHTHVKTRKTLFEESPQRGEPSTGPLSPDGFGRKLPHSGPGSAQVLKGAGGSTSGRYRRRGGAASYSLLLDSNKQTSVLSSMGTRNGSLRSWLWCLCLPIMSRFRRSSTVQPMLQSPMNGNSPPSGDSSSSRRTLNRNSKVAKGMLSIVGLYSCLVILFYSIDFAILRNARDKVALQAVADATAERNYRAVYYAQELAAEEDPAALPMRVADVRNATSALRDAYYTVRMGSNAVTVVGNGIERFPEIAGRGLVKDSESMFKLFYADNNCLRMPEHYPCPDADYPYYQVTRSGADGMMVQMLDELRYLADEAEALIDEGQVHKGFNSSRWDYIYRVGTVDLNDATLRISSQHMSDLKSVLQVVVVMHVVLLLLLMVVFFCFLLMGYLPLLRRMEKEKRRIAEMMSQLPPELDVLRLFSTALMGPKGVQRNSRRGGGGLLVQEPDLTEPSAIISVAPSTLLINSGPPATAAGAPVAAAPAPATLTPCNESLAQKGEEPVDGDTKGYQAWKDILSRTSVNSNTAAARVDSNLVPTRARISKV